MVLYDMAPTDLQHELEPIEVDTFVVLDLDRTLLNSDALGDVQCDMLADFGISANEIEAHQAHIAANVGNSFPVINYLTEIYGAEMVQQIQTRLLERATEPSIRAKLMFPGVIELLEALETHDIPHGILTYGEQENQAFKLRLFELLADREGKLRTEITAENNKSTYMYDRLENARGASTGIFAVPQNLPQERPIGAVRHVIILDDKSVHLDIEHESIEGVLVSNIPSDDGSYPAGTHRLSEFTELVLSLPPGAPLRLSPELRYADAA